ncbi:isochorismatase family protein [Macrococcus armenti]|uniref:Isochorismatase family protein n=1 Tax=Macrococcus armenti TaxID=2875764 RepID=A0ABY3ZUJ0_9STAP|nr:isochorismatase family protein [Macrococcus armenti]UOB20568.1 isochorismatase family protein [Macrococcus armenti]
MIDMNKTALVLIDLQKGILAMDTAPHSTDVVTKNAKRLVDLFKEKGGFVAFVRVKFHDGQDKLNPNAMVELPGKDLSADFSDFADILEVSESDYIVNKRHFSAFFGSDLDLQLRRRGIENIVLGGISTHVGVDTTARDAYQYGYNQYFITDMMSAPRADLHQFSIDNIFPVMGQTMTTEAFIDIATN